MEPVTLIFIVLLSAGIGAEVTKTDDKVTILEQKVQDLESITMKLAGSHASLAARNKIDDETQSRQINDLYDEVDYLNRKVEIYHD